MCFKTKTIYIQEYLALKITFHIKYIDDWADIYTS